jgi:hypothetical protein
MNLKAAPRLPLPWDNRQQTLYGIVDSPIGLASYIRSYLMIACSFDGPKEGLTPDDVVDNVSSTG